MNSAEIRNTFLKYFEKNDHRKIHSSSLVPENDPTLMFANSGMVQFKNIFTGKEEREYNKAVTSQKCVRAGGKHNDLENVGYTARHHTFFEMLGNFSFGDYFKDVAIEFAWNLITKEYSIDRNRLLVTVYKEDEESYNLWKKIAGLKEEQIIKIDTSDNFWSMGDTGPCGPCSEIFYDHGDNYFGGPPGSKDEDGDRFIEIWNLVFMQYEQIDKDKRINLPKPSIDTGMGLERITALLQNTNDNYKTDIFTPLIEKSIELSNNDNNKFLSSHKVIADHLRSACFLIADGVLPSNEGRGYVLRRIMRRGMRHAHTLGNIDPVFHKIFPTFLNQFKNAYPELQQAKDLITNILFNEEIKFKQTVDNGIKILEDEIKETNKNIFSGETAFKLYDTYGFPLDLTQDYLKSKSILVDTEVFELKMIEQKQRARKSWKGTGDSTDNKFWYEVVKDLEPTEFIGYDQIKSECIIKKILYKSESVNEIKNEQEAIIFLNQTTFYGESGGQKGDNGFIYNDNFIFEVNDTKKIFGNYSLHYGKVLKGRCNINNQVTTNIDTKNRNLIKNNHSCTHLLHATLRKILGKHVSQKGSLVNSEKLRFDFNHNEIISDENINKIENIVNEIINQESDVVTEILDHDNAIKSGAMALFGEKYGEDVRVISMGKFDNKFFSIELCGGTHVSNTKEIKKFKIINQTSIASGIRRIEAVTNIQVDNFNNLQNIKSIKITENTIEEINKYINLLKELQSNKNYKFDKKNNIDVELKKIKKIYLDLKENKNIFNNEKDIKIEKIKDYKFIYLIANNYPPKFLKTFVDTQKKLHNNKTIICLASYDHNKVSIIVGITNDLTEIYDSTKLVKAASAIVGGKGGGGRKDLAQAGGNLVDLIIKIPEILKEEILKLT